MLSRNLKVYRILIVLIVVTFLSFDIFCYSKIYWETKKIEKHIVIQTSVSGHTSRPKSESRVARVTAMFLINVVLCYAPMAVYFLFGLFVDEKSHESKHLFYWSVLIIFLNSLTNPAISCVQLSVIRKSVFS